MASTKNEVEVFRSDVPFEAEMVAEALEAEEIACFVRREMAGGLQLTMFETMSPPGQWVVVFVPRQVEERARELISALRSPGHWADDPGDEPDPAFASGAKPAKAKRAYAGVLLLLLIVPFAIGAIAILIALLD